MIDSHKWGIVHTYLTQGKLAYAKRDYDLALKLINSSLYLRQEVDDKLGLAQCYEALAYLKVDVGELELASDFLKKSKNLRSKIAAPLPPINQEAYNLALQKSRSKLD